MAQGRKTGGRQKGSKNKAPKERAAQAAALGLLPHEILLAVARGQRIPTADDPTVFFVPDLDAMIDAAKAAAPYYAPKLSAIEHTGPDGGPIDHSITVNFVRPK